MPSFRKLPVPEPGDPVELARMENEVRRAARYRRALRAARATETRWVREMLGRRASGGSGSATAPGDAA